VSPRPERFHPDPYELFPPTAAGVIAWAQSTRETGGRRPTREAVIEHVRWLRERGLIGAADLRVLAAAGYAER
jgi:hypothetical protein